MGDSPVLPTDHASTTDRIGFRDAQQQKEIKALTAGLQKISNQLEMTKPEGDGALGIHCTSLQFRSLFLLERSEDNRNK